MELTAHLKLRKPASEDYYDVQDHNTNMDLIDAALKEAERRVQWRPVAVRQRESSRPDYGLNGAPEVVLIAEPYSATAEVTVLLDGKEYDAKNLSTKEEGTPEGTIIIRKVED